MFEYDMLEYPPSKLDCRKSLSLLKCSFYKPIWMGNLLILFYACLSASILLFDLGIKWLSDQCFKSSVNLRTGAEKVVVEKKWFH